MASSSSIREEQIPPRGYLYLIILAKGPFNDTQFNISRSLMLFQSTSTTNNLHVFTFFVPFIHSRIFAFMIIEWKCNISAEGTFFWDSKSEMIMWKTPLKESDRIVWEETQFILTAKSTLVKNLLEIHYFMDLKWNLKYFFRSVLMASTSIG